MRSIAMLVCMILCTAAFAQEPHCIDPKELVPSIVKIETTRGSGTGWFWYDGSVIVTARHVVNDVPLYGGKATLVITYNPDGKTIMRVARAKLFLQEGNADDTSRDLAVLMLDQELPGVKPLSIADYHLEHEGWGVVAGYESGQLSTSFVRILGTRKYEGNKRRILLFTGTGERGEVPLFEGYSGSPIADCEGRVLGVLSIYWGNGAILAYKKMLNKVHAERIVTNAGPDSVDLYAALAAALKEPTAVSTLKPAE